MKKIKLNEIVNNIIDGIENPENNHLNKTIDDIENFIRYVIYLDFYYTNKTNDFDKILENNKDLKTLYDYIISKNLKYGLECVKDICKEQNIIIPENINYKKEFTLKELEIKHNIKIIDIKTFIIDINNYFVVKNLLAFYRYSPNDLFNKKDLYLILDKNNYYIKSLKQIKNDYL